MHIAEGIIWKSALVVIQSILTLYVAIPNSYKNTYKQVTRVHHDNYNSLVSK